MPSPTNKAQDNSIRENVYRVIRENITSLQLAPGTTVSTQELAAKLQVSRTPVREAFIRLQKEDLVEITPQKGTMVSRIDLTRAEKERFIRESLETAILPLFYTGVFYLIFIGILTLLFNYIEKKLDYFK